MINRPLALRIALPVPLRRLFDYSIPTGCNLTDFKPGSRVKVPFQSRELVGIIVEVITEADVAWGKLKAFNELIDEESLIPADIWEICLWAAEYYHYPLGEVLSSALPVLLRQGKSASLSQEDYWQLTEKGCTAEPADFKKSPRQAELIKLLSHYPDGITAKELKKLSSHSSALLKTLVEKGWITTFKKNLTLSPSPHAPGNILDLNAEQTEAVEAIRREENHFHVFLLDGVTGSGKTEVYLQAIQHFLTAHKQILVLVPEIGLTPQTLSRFQERFQVPVVALHSGLTEKERLNAWLLAKSGDAKIIIGTRSSIYTPFANLGLIIVDEEHDMSFKQHDTFRYHARDVAIMRAQFAGIPIVLGSATPSLETLHNAKQGRYQHLRLLQRAGIAKMPEYRILDIRKAYLDEGLSQALLTEIKQHLDQDAQVMLFLNRRGFAPVLMCHSCGWTVMCKRCDVRMIYHQSPERLHCHHCDARRNIPKQCEGCQTNDLCKIGQGTERLEHVLKKHFPESSIARIDRDTTQKKGSLEELLNKIHSNEHRILIGTQMLAKGHHFPNVTLVAIIDADNGFFSTDFRAIERMGQLLLQVSGRAGRAEKSGKVLIQTRHPDHPLLHQLLRENYYSFAMSLLQEREKAKLPPYFFFALFRAEAYDPTHATAFLQDIKRSTDLGKSGVTILGPIPAPLARRAGRHRIQLLIQATKRSTLKSILRNILSNIEKIPSKHRVHWSLDIDPIEMV